MGVRAEEINQPRPGLEYSQPRVIGVDLDDSVLWREVLTRLAGFTRNSILRRSIPGKGLDDIQHLDHTPLDVSVGWPLEAISAFFHFRRTGIPGMAEMLREEIANGTPVYGISGRRATKAWYEMTQAQLIQENIPLFGIYLTPKGSSGLESKADSIRELGVTDFYEDDKRTLLYLAKLFPHVRFNYIDHGLTHLTEKDLVENGNINVIPIRELAPPEPKRLGEESAVRNSGWRNQFLFVNPLVGSLQEKTHIKARHVTWAGTVVSIVAVELAEGQNRRGKHRFWRTVGAITIGLVGAGLDGLDGKFARFIRSKMTDEEEKKKDELVGQAEDPFADGVKEGWQAGASWLTAFLRGDRIGQVLALAKLATTNLPRTAKAIAGCFGFKVPETYKIKDILHGDIRFFGTSLGRILPNWVATLFDRIKGVPVQKIADGLVTAANLKVTAERLGTLHTPKGELVLDDEEIEKARFRAVVLTAESAALLGIAGFIAKKFLFRGKNK